MLLLFSTGMRSQNFDYVTEEEEDLIRDAQGTGPACSSSHQVSR
jgi:hypothetical protein